MFSVHVTLVRIKSFSRFFVVVKVQHYVCVCVKDIMMPMFALQSLKYNLVFSFPQTKVKFLFSFNFLLIPRHMHTLKQKIIHQQIESNPQISPELLEMHF